MRRDQAPSTLLICTVLLIGGVSIAHALNCYTGQQLANTPLAQTPVVCPPNSYSCLKFLDMSSQVVTRTCQPSNCTMNGILYSSSICVNISALQTSCCCYGDGCNAAPSGNAPLLALITLPFAAFFAYRHANANWFNRMFLANWLAIALFTFCQSTLISPLFTVFTQTLCFVKYSFILIFCMHPKSPLKNICHEHVIAFSIYLLSSTFYRKFFVSVSDKRWNCIYWWNM